MIAIYNEEEFPCTKATKTMDNSKAVMYNNNIIIIQLDNFEDVTQVIKLIDGEWEENIDPMKQQLNDIEAAIAQLAYGG